MPNDALAAVQPPSEAAIPDTLAMAPPVLSETALGYARQAFSPATRRAYGSHLRAWEAWYQATSGTQPLATLKAQPPPSR